jgi:hypothetical protein
VSVKEKIERQKGAEGVGALGAITYYEYFLPIHHEIIAILKSKIHLLEGGVIPSSLLTYIAHFTSENLAWRLAKENINAWEFITGFPEDFPNQLKKDQELVYKRYEIAVQELRHRASAKPALKNLAALFPRFSQRLLSRHRRASNVDHEFMPGRVGNAL